jgi:sterol 14-demethylase
MTSGQWSTATIVAVSLLCFSTLFTVYRTRSQRGNSSQRIPEVGEFLPLLTAWSFFAKRRDFLWENFKKTGAQIFRFRVLRVRSVTTYQGQNINFHLSITLLP